MCFVGSAEWFELQAIGHSRVNVQRVEIYVGRAVVAMLANNYKRVGIKTGQTNRQTDKQTLLYVLHYIRGQGQKA